VSHSLQLRRTKLNTKRRFQGISAVQKIHDFGDPVKKISGSRQAVDLTSLQPPIQAHIEQCDFKDVMRCVMVGSSIGAAIP
jgi:hypothetical protein